MKGSLSVIFNKDLKQWQVTVPMTLPRQQMQNMHKYVLKIEKDRILSLPKSDKRTEMENAVAILEREGIKQILYNKTGETVII